MISLSLVPESNKSEVRREEIRKVAQLEGAKGEGGPRHDERRVVYADRT
jgi:hypothetical protein